MKKFLLALSLILVCTFLSGCGQGAIKSDEFILLSLVTTKEGAIGQSLNFSVGSKKLSGAGLSKSQIDSFVDKLQAEVKTFRDEFLLNFMLVYNASPNPDFRLGQALAISKVTYNEKTDTVGFDIAFTSHEAWQYYHPSSDAPDDSQTTYGFLIKSTSQGVFPFAAKVGDKTVGERYADAYKKALGDIKIEYSPDLIYDYAQPSRYLKSDADLTTEANGVYHHVWQRKFDGFQDAKISLYHVALNNGVFIVIILGLTLLGIGVTLIIVKYKKRRC